jgi:hypothetical protein
MSRTEVARETSSATTRLVLAYVRERAGDAAVERVLEVADVPHTLAELEDPSSWVSYDSRCRLFAAVVEVLDDPQRCSRRGTTLVTSTITRRCCCSSARSARRRRSTASCPARCRSSRRPRR